MAEQRRQFQLAFTGKWDPVHDPMLLEKGDYSDLSNMRYLDRGMKGVSGYSKINAVRWLQINPDEFDSETMWGLAHGDGLWVAVGENRKVAISEDGFSWTAIDVSAIFAANDDISAVSYGGGQWVIAGGSGPSKIATSPDGTTWTSRTPAVSDWFRNVAYGNGLWVLVGGYISKATVQTSPNGITWTQRTSAATEYLWGVDHDDTNNLWAIASTDLIETSPDGITWTSQTIPTGFALFDIEFNQDNLWISAGYNAGKTKLLSSPNGTEWSEITTTVSEPVECITYGGGLWFIGHTNGKIDSSTDGIEWEEESAGNSNNVYGIAYDGSMWLAVGESGMLMMRY